MTTTPTMPTTILAGPQRAPRQLTGSLKVSADLLVFGILLVIGRPAAAQIAPFATYSFDLPNNLFEVTFGYDNMGSSITIVPGPENEVPETGLIFVGQPFGFDPGFDFPRFSVSIDLIGQVRLTWNLKGSSAAFDSKGDFFYHYLPGIDITISESAGFHGLYSHAVSGDGFWIKGESTLQISDDLIVAADGQLIQSGGFLTTRSLTIDAGGQWIYLGGSMEVAQGITNWGSATWIGVTVDTPVHNEAGSTTDIVGDVTFTAPVTGPGAFFGSGTAHFDGDFAPGDSPGVVPFETSVQFGSANSLEIELGGVAMGEFDRLEIEGDAELDGMLVLSLVSPFEPSFGDTFEILDVAGTLTGQFNGLDEGTRIDVGSALSLAISYTGGDGNDVVLTAVPEPAAWQPALALLSLASIRGRWRRLNAAILAPNPSPKC